MLDGAITPGFRTQWSSQGAHRRPPLVCFDQPSRGRPGASQAHRRDARSTRLGSYRSRRRKPRACNVVLGKVRPSILDCSECKCHRRASDRGSQCSSQGGTADITAHPLSGRLQPSLTLFQQAVSSEAAFHFSVTYLTKPP